MKSNVLENLANLGAEVDEFFQVNDFAQGKIQIINNYNPLYNSFNVNVIRFLENWQIIGTTWHNSTPNRTSTFSVNVSNNLINISIGGFSTILEINNSKLTVVNSIPTGELSIFFNDNYGQIYKGCFLYFRDII